ncbi:protein-L-isoaspartate O-methyltransferase [Halostagnicola sp. A56]|uniref:protein-L-isoaspartate O-methyltransferase family protein n=1 Tax=Halostagnicola sp. A56 TaxID=1495067 RepID=UPI0004A055C3|nr:protein-L-isoaspartate O-methyltransferase [Halostagnicola sp. A56]KDE59427.1 protein-L-isoaspartate O-methyltransferase [Halostagnicola sp. A56]
MDPAVLREDMVDGLESPAKGVLTDGDVAMRDVDRHEFFDDERLAYADRDSDCLGTRVLAPSVVARLLQFLSPNPDDDVLIVGAGVGYTAAVAAELVGEANVHAIDIARSIVYEARANLENAGYGGILVDCADGAAGLPAYAPFDRILLEAAAQSPPKALVRQLTDDGRLVYPQGANPQRLTAVAPDGTPTAVDRAVVSFDPLLVEGEQSGAVERNRTAREDREHAIRHAQSRRGWEQEWIEWEGTISSRSR